MKPFGKWLSDEEVADIASYLRGSFGNTAGAVNAEQVQRQRSRRRGQNLTSREVRPSPLKNRCVCRCRHRRPQCARARRREPAGGLQSTRVPTSHRTPSFSVYPVLGGYIGTESCR